MLASIELNFLFDVLVVIHFGLLIFFANMYGTFGELDSFLSVRMS